MGDLWTKPDFAPLPAAPLQYLAVLPDFEVQDLDGKTWRLSDLKGKATFIDIWATWCGPCRAEHPELQKLYSALRERKDIQVLTFSIDETAYAADAYRKENKYGFPVIVSKDVVQKLFPVVGIPQAWFVNSEGRRSAPSRLFTVEKAIEELQRAARK